MQEVRCTKCNKLLYRITEVLVSEVDYYTREESKIECKCPRCGTMNTK